MDQVHPAGAARAAAATLTSSSSSCATLHTSAVLRVESARKRQARLTRQKNLAKRDELQKKAAAARPHVILGTIASSDEEATAKWAACDLAKVLVRPDELAHDAPAQRISLPLPADEADVSVPPSLAFGLRAREQRMLFEHLPLLSADMRTRREMTMVGNWQRWGDAGAGGDGGGGDGQKKDAEGMAVFHEMELVAGVAQANALARVVDLRNANAAGVAFENRRRVVEAFSAPGKPNDTGRTEVQGTSWCPALFFNISDIYFLALVPVL